MFSFIVSNSGFLIHRWFISSDLRRSCTVRQLIPLEQISLADALEWFPFCSDSDLRRNSTVNKKFLQALRNLFPFGSHSDRTWAYNLMGIPFGDSPLLSLVPRSYFRWDYCWNFPMSASELIPFVACSDRFCYLRSTDIPSRGFLLVFPCWGFTLIVCSQGTKFPP